MQSYGTAVPRIGKTTGAKKGGKTKSKGKAR